MIFINTFTTLLYTASKFDLKWLKHWAGKANHPNQIKLSKLNQTKQTKSWLVLINSLSRPNHIFLDMTTQNVCRYFMFWFCKYTVKCGFLHVKENCESQECDVRSCLRHPKICWFFRDYSRCKFGKWCCFRHVHRSIESGKEIINRINNFEKLIAEKDAKITSLENKTAQRTLTPGSFV